MFAIFHDLSTILFHVSQLYSCVSPGCRLKKAAHWSWQSCSHISVALGFRKLKEVLFSLVEQSGVRFPADQALGRLLQHCSDEGLNSERRPPYLQFLRKPVEEIGSPICCRYPCAICDRSGSHTRYSFCSFRESCRKSENRNGMSIKVEDKDKNNGSGSNIQEYGSLKNIWAEKTWSRRETHDEIKNTTPIVITKANNLRHKLPIGNLTY